MMKASVAAAVLLASAVSAQRPADQSICDYYTTALLKDNTAANQQTLLTLVVNTAIIGNYTQPNVGVSVPGILAPGMYNGEAVNLAPYFTGALLSSNRGGSKGVSVNFLDGGAAAPLKMNMPANDTSSAQYKLVTHLYKYFAYLLSCSQYGNTTMQYDGFTNMFQVHRFMDLDTAEVGWFIQQVGLSAASFGVADADVQEVGKALNMTFGYRCSANVSVPASAPAAPQAICAASDCPLAPNATCAAYPAVFPPGNATSSSNSTMPSGTGSGSGSGSSSTPSSTGSGSGSGPTPSVTSTNAGAWVQPIASLGLAILFGSFALLL